MGYIKAEEILPKEMIEMIQEYVEGQNIYIPRRPENRVKWGTKTHLRRELEYRNNQVYKDFCKGMSIKKLASKYFLSEKSIQRIIGKMK